MTTLLAPSSRVKPARPFGLGVFPAAHDAIPTSVEYIRLASKPYQAVQDPAGRREWLALDGSGSRTPDIFMTKPYQAGRVAILDRRPADARAECRPKVSAEEAGIVPPRPAMTEAVAAWGNPFRPGTVESSWWSGFTLGRDGVDARPTASEADAEAFSDGLKWGSLDRDADLEATYLDDLARSETVGYSAEDDDTLTGEWAHLRADRVALA